MARSYFITCHLLATLYYDDRAIWTANVICKITFALNTAVTCNCPDGLAYGPTAFTHNDNNILVTSCTDYKNIDSLWV